MTDLHEPLEPLESYPDELPPPRHRGDVNLVGLLSVADDLARSLAALKIRVQPHDPKTSLVSPEKARENTAKEVDRLLGTAVYLQRHAHAAMLGRCVLGADGHPGCAPRKLSAAEREFARNKARIEAGETFRGQKSSDWRLGSSPSSTRPAR